MKRLLYVILSIWVSLYSNAQDSIKTTKLYDENLNGNIKQLIEKSYKDSTATELHYDITYYFSPSGLLIEMQDLHQKIIYNYDNKQSVR